VNRDDIIRMAREAGIKDPAPARQGFKMYANPQRLERFAALVAAHEREKLVQVSPLEFIAAAFDKEFLYGKPIMWAEWPNRAREEK